MASKLALTAALLMALVALATATIYTTTITTTTIDDEANPQQQQQCQQQIQGRQFQSCQRYLSQRSSQYDGEEGESVLEMSTDINPQQQSQQLRDCCKQLRGVSQQCRCEAIKHAVRQQQQHQQGGQQGQQMQQVYQKARNLPQSCQFQQPQQCDIRVIFV